MGSQHSSPDEKEASSFQGENFGSPILCIKWYSNCSFQRLKASCDMILLTWFCSWVHQAIAFAIASRFCHKCSFARNFRSENKMFAISFARPFAIASEVIGSNSQRLVCNIFFGIWWQTFASKCSGPVRIRIRIRSRIAATAVHSILLIWGQLLAKADRVKWWMLPVDPTHRLRETQGRNPCACATSHTVSHTSRPMTQARAHDLWSLLSQSVEPIKFRCVLGRRFWKWQKTWVGSRATLFRTPPGPAIQLATKPAFHLVIKGVWILQKSPWISLITPRIWRKGPGIRRKELPFQMPL